MFGDAFNDHEVFCFADGFAFNDGDSLADRCIDAFWIVDLESASAVFIPFVFGDVVEAVPLDDCCFLRVGSGDAGGELSAADFECAVEWAVRVVAGCAWRFNGDADVDCGCFFHCLMRSSGRPTSAVPLMICI